MVGDHFKTPWGSTPHDVLRIALGTHRTPLTWQHEPSFVYGAEGTRTILQVKIARKGPATFVRRDGNTDPCRPGGGPCSLMLYECASQLLIPVHVQATTHDGVLDVEGDTQLIVSSRGYIGVSLGQQFATHRGTLQIRELREKGLSAPGFGISLGFSRKRTMVGAIRGSYEVANVGGLFVEYACFPERSPPELRGSDEEVGCRG